MKREFGLDAELIAGGRGEFTVWVDGKKIADKAGGDFPSVEAIVAAARLAIR